MNRPIATWPREVPSSEEHARCRPRLAIIGSPGLAYLRALICAASIRQGFDVDFFPWPYADYRDLLADRYSELYLFRPDVVLLTVEAGSRLVKSGRARTFDLSHWAKQQLGAALIRNTVLPTLSRLYAVQSRPQHTSLFSVMEAMQRQLGSLPGQEKRMLSSVCDLTRSEMLIRWHVPALWHRTKRDSASALLKHYPVGRVFAGLFGLCYSCLVVDISSDPTSGSKDIPSFLGHWSKTHRQKADRIAASSPDSFLFVDCDPFPLMRRRRG